MTDRSTVRALVLSGGGAKGAFEAGLASTLVSEYQEQFDIVCGTSIGGINAAFIAQDDIEGLTSLWHTIACSELISVVPQIATLRDLFTLVQNVMAKPGLLRWLGYPWAVIGFIRAIVRLHPIGRLMQLTGAVDPEHIRGLLTKSLRFDQVRRVLIATATDLTVQQPSAFYCFPDEYADLKSAFLHEEPNALPFSVELFTEQIRASGAIPGAFAPVEASAGTLFVDGGVTNNTPIGQAIDAGATEVTVIYLDPQIPTIAATRPPNSLVEILFECYSVMQQRLLALDYMTALRTNTAAKKLGAGADNKRQVRLRSFAPATALAVNVLGFSDQKNVDLAFAQGQAAARVATDRLEWDTHSP